jgi:hypothetical protein
LDSGTVTNESGGHLQAFWWDITDTGFDVIWDPFNEV